MHSVTLAQAVVRPDLFPEVPESSLLRTPSAIEGEGGAIRADVARQKNRMLMVRDQMAQLAADNGLPVSASLLPTPNTMEHREIKTPEQIAELKLKSPGGYRNLREVIIHEIDSDKLLPTPIANEGEKATNRQTAEQRKQTGQVYLTNRVQSVRADSEPNETNWGQFEPAIRRWERITGRPAPAPTEPSGKDGNHRLSAKFTEWMMGMPDGWITAPEIGITRNEMLKACGNGVVPQQAENAIRQLLDRL